MPMMRHARLTLVVGLCAAALVSPAGAQERVGNLAPPQQERAPGWTFTPTFGFAETYDDNISLFGVSKPAEESNDYIASYFPGADLHYAGRHTSFGTQYHGSFLDYRTFSALNRWDQRGGIELRREETARVKWSAQANAAAVPSTDLIDLGGIPFRQTGAETIDVRGNVDYLLGGRSQASTSLRYQDVTFDRSLLDEAPLRGGHILESLTSYRYKLNARLAVGADYAYTRAAVLGDLDVFNIHSAMAAAGYDLGPAWSLSGGAGVVYLEATSFSPSHSAPAGHVSLDMRRNGTMFHVGYLRSYIPSFGFGGTSTNQEVGVSFRTPLFNNPHVYTTQSGVFRDDTPLTDLAFQLPLRSLRTYSIIGWQPDRWVRLEGFYARVQQTSLRAGGQVYRNQIGFQIVTSKPMRMQ
jgi:hypothetical protein